MVERTKEERHINSGESDHSFLNITNRHHEPNPDVLKLALYAYLIMVHFDIRRGIDKIDADNLASWCRRRARVFVGWCLSEWGETTLSQSSSYYVVYGGGGLLEVEIWESMEQALRVTVWELKSIY